MYESYVLWRAELAAGLARLVCDRHMLLSMREDAAGLDKRSLSWCETMLAVAVLEWSMNAAVGCLHRDLDALFQ